MGWYGSGLPEESFRRRRKEGDSGESEPDPPGSGAT